MGAGDFFVRESAVAAPGSRSQGDVTGKRDRGDQEHLIGFGKGWSKAVSIISK
jgi:hypothetical protein